MIRENTLRQSSVQGGLLPFYLGISLRSPSGSLNIRKHLAHIITWFTSRDSRRLLDFRLQFRCQNKSPKPLLFLSASSPKEIQYLISLARSCSLLRMGWLLRVLASQLSLGWWFFFRSLFISLGLRHKVILSTKLNTNGVLFIPNSFSSQTFRYKINLE